MCKIYGLFDSQGAIVYVSMLLKQLISIVKWRELQMLDIGLNTISN